MTKIAIASFAHVHATAYAAILKQIPDIELLSCDEGAPQGSGVTRGAGLAEELGVPYVESYRELWDWQPAGVIVCAENSRHRSIVLQAAAAGSHILCEKPLATTVADGEAMLAACEQAGVFLMMAYPVHFAPEQRGLVELVRAGKAGQLLLGTGTNNGKIPVGSREWFTDPDLAGGGAIVDHTVHVAELLDEILDGELPSAIHAYSNQILHADNPAVRAETGGMVMLSYPSGFQASIDCSWSQPLGAPVWGGLTLELLTDRGRLKIAPFGDKVGGFSQSQKNAIWIGLQENLDQLMLEEFLRGIKSGAVPQPDGSVGLRTLKIMVAAQQSARSQQVVEFPR